MTTFKIIGLCGYAGAGKDAAALAIDSICPGKFKRYAFADELKSQCVRMLQAVELFPDFSDPEVKKIWRPFLVAWGRQRRILDKYYWVDNLIDEMLRDVDRGMTTTPIITDVRYVNEVKAIQEAGGVVIRIHREGVGPANEEEQINTALIIKEFPLMWNVENRGTEEELGQHVLEVAEAIYESRTINK